VIIIEIVLEIAIDIDIGREIDIQHIYIHTIPYELDTPGTIPPRRLSPLSPLPPWPPRRPPPWAASCWVAPQTLRRRSAGGCRNGCRPRCPWNLGRKDDICHHQ